MARPKLDSSEWPLLVVTIPRVAMTHAELVEYLKALSTHYGRGRFGLVVDVTGCPGIGADERRLIAQNLDEDTASHPGVLACMAVVTDSAINRGIFKAISWLTSAAFAREAFASLPQAKRWAQDLVAAPHIVHKNAR